MSAAPQESERPRDREAWLIAAVMWLGPDDTAMWDSAGKGGRGYGQWRNVRGEQSERQREVRRCRERRREREGPAATDASPGGALGPDALPADHLVHRWGTSVWWLLVFLGAVGKRKTLKARIQLEKPSHWSFVFVVITYSKLQDEKWDVRDVESTIQQIKSSFYPFPAFSPCDSASINKYSQNLKTVLQPQILAVHIYWFPYCKFNQRFSILWWFFS